MGRHFLGFVGNPGCSNGHGYIFIQLRRETKFVYSLFDLIGENLLIKI
jgi:hypothetical protein